MAYHYFTLQDVANIVNGKLVGGEGTAEIRVISDHSGNLTGGKALFFAIRREKDGHDYLEAAATNGAIAAVVQDPSKAPGRLPLIVVPDTLKAYGDLAREYRRQFDIQLVGVTGSYGKTTTRAFTSQALSAKFSTLFSEGSLNNEFGVPRTLFNLDSSYDVAVLEMGMRGLGQIKYLADIALPTVGVITNIGPQHIELLGTLDNIAQAKAELLSALPESGLAVLPFDDDRFDFLRRCCQCRIVTFGLQGADYELSNITVENNGLTSFSLSHAGQGIIRVKLPIAGKHNALNAAAALAVAVELGVALTDAAHALESAVIPGGRMEIIENPARGITIINDCYNAGPNSVRAAIDALRERPGSARKVAILGEMAELGEYAEQNHRDIGVLASTSVGAVLGVGEETKAILEELRGHVVKDWCANADEAAERAKTFVKNGDVVLVKGSRIAQLEKVVAALSKQ